MAMSQRALSISRTAGLLDGSQSMAMMFSKDSGRGTDVAVSALATIQDDMSFSDGLPEDTEYTAFMDLSVEDPSSMNSAEMLQMMMNNDSGILSGSGTQVTLGAESSDIIDDDDYDGRDATSPVMLDENGIPINDIINKFSQMFSQLRASDGPSRVSNTIKMREKVDMSKFEKPPVEDYGINIQQLKKWKHMRMQKLLEQEVSQQEVALSKVRGFMEAITKLTKIQSWWRMMGWKKTFNEYRMGRKQIKREFFGAWKRHMITEKMFLNYMIGKPFHGWASEVEESKRLNQLISTFFTTCIKRLKLTPQAVMAYFSQEDFGKLLSESDRTKIRRLILNKLFTGWGNEIRTQKVFRYRASVILSRMMRKTRGPMWSKEMTLLFFHMWRRYVAVRTAYRRGEPDPVFKTPYIHQWTIYLQQLTMSRIYKRRALENGKQLILMRSVRRWKFMMAEDRSKPKDPIATARLYYRRKLCVKLFQGWFGCVREKGKIMRNREKYFLAWKTWAPIERRLRKHEQQAAHLMREKNLVRIFDTMIKLCKEAMGRRAAALKTLSGSMFNRKLLMCVYALMNRIPNVLMIDCWRRWCLWTRNRKKYLSFLWQFRYQYHEARSRMIFNGWKEYVRFRKFQGKVTPGRTRKGSLLGSDDDRSVGSNTTLDTVDKDFQTIQLQALRVSSNAGNAVNSNSFSYNSPRSTAIKPGNSFNNVSSASFHGRGTGLSPLRSPSVSGPVLIPSSDDNASVGSAEWAAGTVGTVDFGGDVESDCDRDRVSNPLLFPLIMENALRIFSRSRKQIVSVTSSPTAFNFFCEVCAQSNARAFVEEVKLMSTIDAGGFVDGEGVTEDSSKTEIRKLKTLFEKLQNAVNNLHLDDVAAAVEGGARVVPSHISYVGKFISDEYVPLYSYLLSSCPMYFAQRVVRQDRQDAVMEITSPLSAVLMSSQVARWEQRLLTGRESAFLVGSASQAVIGTDFQTNIIWRAAVLSLLKLRGQELALKCVKLQPTRTVDEEVVEVMKRQRVARIIAVRQAIASLLCIDLSNELQPLVVPELITSDPPWTKGAPIPRKITANAFDNAAQMNIYELLKQYTQITGQLTSEAKALRLPMIQRDDRLNHNGFLRQARADFLALRQMCLTPDQIRQQKATDYAKEMAAVSKKDKEFTLKENVRKKQHAAEVAAKKKAQKEIAHKIAMRLLPANAMSTDMAGGDSPALSTEAVLGQAVAVEGTADASAAATADLRMSRLDVRGRTDRSVSVSADGRPPRSGTRSPTPAHKKLKESKTRAVVKKETVVVTQRKFSFLEEGDEVDSAQSSTTNTPREPGAPKEKVNPLKALFTKDPTKSAKQVSRDEKNKSTKSQASLSSKFLYDGENFSLAKKEAEEAAASSGSNMLARGAAAAVVAAKEEHIKAMLKAATSTSIGKSVRKKSDLPAQAPSDDEEDGDNDEESVESTDSEGTVLTKDNSEGAKNKEADDLTAAAKLKAKARLKAAMTDKNWDEDDDSINHNHDVAPGQKRGVGSAQADWENEETAKDDTGGKRRSSNVKGRTTMKMNGVMKVDGQGGKNAQTADDDEDDEASEAGDHGIDETAEAEDAEAGDVNEEAGPPTDTDLDAGSGDENMESRPKAKGKKVSSKGGKKISKSGKNSSLKKSGKGDNAGKKLKSRSPSPDKLTPLVIKKPRAKAVSQLRDRNIRNEEFAERAKSFSNLLLESWQCRAKREIESVQRTLVNRECAFARFVSESLLVQFLNDGGMQQPSNPPEASHGGLSGWIMKKSLTDISFITAEVWVLFIPHDWWKVPCIYERLENEFLLVNTLNAAGKLRIRSIESKDVLIQDQQRDATNYLKTARREVAAIGAKRFQIIQEDLGQQAAMKRIIVKSKAAVVKANSQLHSFRETMRRGESLLAAQDYDGVFELFGEGAGYNENVVDLTKIGARAIAVLEKQQLTMPKLYQRIVDSEAMVKKAENDMRNFEKSTARVQEMLRRFGEGRFNIVIDVQQVCQRNNMVMFNT
jgi:hypothetical protein